MSFIKCFAVGIITVGVGLQLIEGLVRLLDSIRTNRLLKNSHIERLIFANHKNQVCFEYLENCGHAMQDDQLNEDLRLFLQFVEEKRQNGRKCINFR